METQAQEKAVEAPPASVRSKLSLYYVLDGCILLLMGTLLLAGVAWQFSTIYDDAARYTCYAVAFWQGTPALHHLPSDQCSFYTHPTTMVISNATVASTLRQTHVPGRVSHFIETQPTQQPLHAMPREYPLLTILPFSLSLLTPADSSQLTFALGMVLLAALLYVVLVRFKSRGAAIAFALYLVVGAWGTAAGRFDLVPAALTLFALLCAVKRRWNWAFVWLALATLMKFYPAALILPFVLAQQQELTCKWSDRQRWRGLGIFVGLCVGITILSLLLSVEGTLSPLTYFGNRPVQVESTASSLIWLESMIMRENMHFAYTFGSLNVTSPNTFLSSLLPPLLLVAGLLTTLWLQWRAKITVATASLLVLLVIMITGKVFSPQYLIWIIPLVAYVGANDLRWLMCWTLIGLLTMWIYPVIYVMTPLMHVPQNPLFYPVVTLRNMLLLGFIVAVLVAGARDRLPVVREQAVV